MIVFDSRSEAEAPSSDVTIKNIILTFVIPAEAGI